MMDSASKLDVVVFGATGYAANRLLEHLEQDGDFDDLIVGIAGRKRDGLENLKCEFAKSVAEIIVADVEDFQSLVEMTRRTRLVLNFVGPYASYGEPVIKACLETGTDYLDLSGETGWIHQMREKYDHQARVKGCTILSACGWDSIPADGLLYLALSGLSEEERKYRCVMQTLVYMGQRKRFFGPFGGMGAGTFRTIVEGWHRENGLLDVRVHDQAQGSLLSTEETVSYFPEFKLYGLRNELFSDGYVVRTSYDLLPSNMKPKSFEYGHYFAAPYWVVISSVSIMMALLRFLMKWKFLYKWLTTRLILSGAGPTKAQRENSCASLHSRLRLYDGPNLLKTKEIILKTDQDPNDVTAKLLLRCAHLLLTKKKTTPKMFGTTTAVFQGEMGNILKSCFKIESH